MQISARRAAASSCRTTSSRRTARSAVSATSSTRRRSLAASQRHNVRQYRVAAVPGDGDVSRMDRWEDKLDDVGSADTHITTGASGERGPSEVAVFESGAGPAATRMHQEHHKLEAKSSELASDIAAAAVASSSSTRSSSSAGRDTSDMQSGSPGASSSSAVIDPEKARIRAEESDSPTPRAHPVARTAGTAAASAAGTIIGAVAGPVGAAAGAALGAALGRRAADLLGGSEEQNKVYEAGAEPEQVAEDVLTARAAVSDIATDAVETVQAKASGLADRASDLVDRASERLQGDTGGSSAQTAAYTDIGAVNTFDTGMEGPAPTLSQAFGSSDLTLDSDGDLDHPDRSRSGKSVKSKVTDAARSAADRVAGAAETVKDATVSAAQTAADKIGDVAGDIPLPEFPPASDHGDFHSAGGGVRLEDDKTLQAARDKVSGAAESARDHIGSAAAEVKDRAGAAANAASERLSGARDAAADAAGSTARTAADYGSSDRSERMQEMGNKGQSTSTTKSSALSGTPDAEWGSSRDLGAMPSAEALVKSDVGTPMGSSLIQQDNMPLMDQGSSAFAATDSSSSMAAGAASRSGGGYTDAAADLNVDTVRGRSLGITSDSTAERVAQVYGVGPEASAGVQEADTYRAEAGSDAEFSTRAADQGSASNKGSNKSNNQGLEGGDLMASERERLGVAGQDDSFAAAVSDAAAAAGAIGEGQERGSSSSGHDRVADEAAKLADFVKERAGDDELGLGNAPQRKL